MSQRGRPAALRSRVDAVEHAAVPRQERPLSFTPAWRFTARLEQVADDAAPRAPRPARRQTGLHGRSRTAAGVRAKEPIAGGSVHRRGHERARDALPGLAGADRRGELAAPQAPAGEVGRGVGDPDDRHDASSSPRSCSGSSTSASARRHEHEPARASRAGRAAAPRRRASQQRRDDQPERDGEAADGASANSPARAVRDARGVEQPRGRRRPSRGIETAPRRATTRARRAHSQAASAAIAAATRRPAERGSRNSAARSAAISTIAVTTRSPSIAWPGPATPADGVRQAVRRRVGACDCDELLAGAAEAALAPAVRGDRGVERRGVEVGPQRLGEVELGVRELPQQEVADALLAAGADEEVGLGRVAHREIGREVAPRRCRRRQLRVLARAARSWPAGCPSGRRSWRRW